MKVISWMKYLNRLKINMKQQKNQVQIVGKKTKNKNQMRLIQMKRVQTVS